MSEERTVKLSITDKLTIETALRCQAEEAYRHMVKCESTGQPKLADFWRTHYDDYVALAGRIQDMRHLMTEAPEEDKD